MGRSEQCPNCREGMQRIKIKPVTSDGYTVCSEWCKAEWELDLKEGEPE